LRGVPDRLRHRAGGVDPVHAARAGWPAVPLRPHTAPRSPRRRVVGHDGAWRHRAPRWRAHGGARPTRGRGSTMTTHGTPLLRARGLSKRFGGLAAVSDVSFDVHAGEIFAIIGPNGAGKTTTLNLVSGLLAPTGGTRELQGADLTTPTTHARCHLGLGRACQAVEPFPAW